MAGIAAARAPARAPAWLRRLGSPAAASGSVLAVLVIWLLVGQARLFTAFLLPPLGVVVERLATDAASGDLALETWQTLLVALSGFAVAGLGGVVLGVLMVNLRGVRWFFDPLVSLAYPMPKIAFLPVFMLWLGPGTAAKIFIVAISAIFPVITATVAGTEAVEKTLLWSARSLGAGRAGLLWQIVLPAAVPQIFTGLQIGLPMALITTVVAEMLMGSDGLGGAMLGAMRFADSPGVFSGIIAMTILGFVLVKLMEILRARLLRWHPESLQN